MCVGLRKAPCVSTFRVSSTSYSLASGLPIHIQEAQLMQRDGKHTLSFYPNVTTLRSGLRHVRVFDLAISSVDCVSVCRLSVCLSSVTLVHPTQVVEAFGKLSSPLCTLAIL